MNEEKNNTGNIKNQVNKSFIEAEKVHIGDRIKNIITNSGLSLFQFRVIVSVLFFITIGISFIIFLNLNHTKPTTYSQVNFLPQNEMPTTTKDFLNNYPKIPSGTYRVGRSEACIQKIFTETNYKIEEVANEEAIKIDSFRIGKYEISEEEYYKFIVETGYDPPSYWDKNNLKKYALSMYPVVKVNWWDATEYCQWLQKELKVKEVRLPTENEWEIAARKTSSNIFPWKSDVYPLKPFVNFHGSKTVTVNSMPSGASPFEVFHMGGNVAEWCEPSPRKNKTQVCGKQKVLKGGSFRSNNPFTLTCTHAPCFPADIKAKHIGFRVVIIE